MLAQNHGDEKVRHLDSLSLWSKHWLNSVTAAEKNGHCPHLDGSL